jgi:hypothetical protein
MPAVSTAEPGWGAGPPDHQAVGRGQDAGHRRTGGSPAGMPSRASPVAMAPPGRATEPAAVAALPTWRDSGPVPAPSPAPTPAPARRPRADQPWRRGYQPRSAA